MPALVYTGMLMTENRVLHGRHHELFASRSHSSVPPCFGRRLPLAAIGLTCAVRPQGLILLVIAVTALVLKLAFDLRAPDGIRGVRSVTAELRRYLPSAAALLLLVAGYVALKASQGLGSRERARRVRRRCEGGRRPGHRESLGRGSLRGNRLLRGPHPGERADRAVRARRPRLAVDSRRTSLCRGRLFRVRPDRGPSRHLRLALRPPHRGANMCSVAPLLLLALCLWLSKGLPRPAADDRRSRRAGCAAPGPGPAEPAQRRNPLRHLRPHPIASALDLDRRRNGHSRAAHALGRHRSRPGLRAPAAPDRDRRAALVRRCFSRTGSLVGLRLHSRRLASDACADADVRAELDRRANRHRRRGRDPVRSDGGALWRGAAPVADGVLEPERRDGLQPQLSWTRLLRARTRRPSTR